MGARRAQSGGGGRKTGGGSKKPGSGGAKKAPARRSSAPKGGGGRSGSKPGPAAKKPNRKKAPPKKPGAKKAPARGGKSGPGAPRAPKAPGAGRRIQVTARPGGVPSDVPDVGGKSRAVRLNRFLAEAGICSRRAADELIESGAVTVNGEPATELGLRVDPEVDDVRYSGEPVKAERKVYVLFNKPKGVVCTNAAGEQRPRVIDHLPDIRGRVYTVGRLDAESEGLILVTNDGDFAQTMAHPSHGVPKTYAVLVRGKVTPDVLQKVRGGVWLSEGRTGGAQARIERTSKDRTYLKVVLREGRNREIRRVFARLGYPVRDLKRVRIGSLSLHGLGRGRWRFLTRAEIRDLLVAARSDS
jgi:23S rRNA pseudouridine2605 synthase